MNLALEAFDETILTLLASGSSYADISEYLRQVGETCGLSTRSVRRYSRSRGVRVRPQVDQACLDRVVSTLVGRFGHGYGRRTMHGQSGVRACQAMVALSLHHIAPIQYAARRSFASRLLNPYQARFFGEKYQNEKCVMFGVTLVWRSHTHSR